MWGSDSRLHGITLSCFLRFSAISLEAPVTPSNGNSRFIPSHSSHIPAHSPPVEKRREQGRCAPASKGPARLRRSGRHRHVRSLCGLRRLRARRCVLPCGRRHDRRLRKRPHGAVAPRRCKATLSFAFALVWRLHDRRRAERCGRQLHHVALGTGNYRMSPCRICAFAGKGIPLAARNRKGRGRSDPPPPAEAQDPGRNAKASRTKDRKLAVKPQSSAEHAIEAIERVVARRNRIVIASSAVYAFCFGQLQGALTLENVPVLFSSNGAVLLGIALAGLIIYSVPKQANSIIFMNFVHRCSMVVYVAGALALPLALSHPFLAVVAQIVILAGFNLFDFSSLIYGIREDNVVAGITVSTRPIVYGGMAIGLLLGSALVLASSAVAWEDLIVVLCSFSSLWPSSPPC